MQHAAGLRGESLVEAWSVDPRRAARTRGPAHQAYLILYAAFVVAPLVDGVDKFFHLLVDRDQYLAPGVVLRDIGLSLGALALGRVAAQFDAR